MADPDQLALLKRSVKEWNAWRDAYPKVTVKLSEADLRGANLSRANLSSTVSSTPTPYNTIKINSLANLRGANLSGANLSDANLNGTDLRGATLTEASLSGATLIGALLGYTHSARGTLSGPHLSKADPSRVNLSKADLSGANLSRADLREVNFSGANLNGANLNGADLSGADLHEANLHEANLNGANLNGANLSKAKRGPLPPKNTEALPHPNQSSSTTDWLSLVEIFGSNLLLTAATLASIIQGLDVVERRWREHQEKHKQQGSQTSQPASASSNQPAASPSHKTPAQDKEITEILLVMDDGSQHGFKRWVSNPDDLKVYMDAFSDPKSPVKPLRAVFKKREGRALVVDVTNGGKDNKQLNVILKYLEADPV